MNKKRRNSRWAMLLAVSALAAAGCQYPLGTRDDADKHRIAPVVLVPTFRIDQDWPHVPDGWKLGEIASIAIDGQDNAWILHRPQTLSADQANLMAPPVLGFDSDGKFLKAWGGPGDAYQWPYREHGIYVDYRGFFWVGGGSCQPVADDQLLKFAADGRFVMQIGHSNSSGGNADTRNLHGPGDVVVYAPTNELFVADGYGNNRVIVFDADTGTFKRMWGAFGNVPEDDDKCPNSTPESVPQGPGPAQFSIVHAIRVSNDGLVYVADRENRRVQVFTLAGKYIKQVVWPDDLFARDLALSRDADQRFLYVGGRSGYMVLDRQSLDVLTTIEGAGIIGPGHHIQTDSKGNLYIAFTRSGYQRLLFTGLAPLATN